jgi:hypothetical protein
LADALAVCRQVKPLPLPNRYDEAAGLFAAGLIIVVLSAFKKVDADRQGAPSRKIVKAVLN